MSGGRQPDLSGRYRVTVERATADGMWHRALDYRTQATTWRDALARASDFGYTADTLPEPGLTVFTEEEEQS